MVKKGKERVMMRVDPMFRDMLKAKSEELNVSMSDLTAMAGRQGLNETMFTLKKRKKKNLFDLEIDEDLFKI